MPFDPNQPFEIVGSSGGGFDPNQPFEVVGAEPQAGDGGILSFDNLANYGKSVFRGLGNLAGFISDYNPLNPTGAANREVNAWAGQEVVPSLTSSFNQGLQSVGLNPSYAKGSGAELVGAGFEALPTALAGGGLTSAFLSGIGAKAAENAGYGTGGQLVGALAGGVGPQLAKTGVKSLVNAFRPSVIAEDAAKGYLNLADELGAGGLKSYDPVANQATLGSAIDAGVASTERAAKDNYQKLAAALQGKTLETAAIADALESGARARLAPGEALNSKITDMVEALRGSPAIPWTGEGSAQNLYSRLGKLGEDVYGTRLSGGIEDARKAIRTAEEVAFGTNVAKDIQEARSAYGAMVDDTRTGLASKFTADKVDTANLAQRVINSPKDAEQIVKLVSTTPEGIGSLRTEVIANLAKKDPQRVVDTLKNKFQSFSSVFGEDGAKKLLSLYEGKGTVGNALIKKSGLAETLIYTGAGTAIGMKVAGPIGAFVAPLVAIGKITSKSAAHSKVVELLGRAAIGDADVLAALSKPMSKANFAAAKKALLQSPLVVNSKTAGEPDSSANGTTQTDVKQHALSLPSLVSEAQAEEPVEPKEYSKLVEAVIKAESDGKAGAKGPDTRGDKVTDADNAKGLMQLMDATGKEWATKLGYAKYDPYDAEQNKAIGSAYLKWLIDKFSGDVELGLAAYNHGIGNVLKKLTLAAKAGNDRSFESIKSSLPKETQRYVSKITKNFYA